MTTLMIKDLSRTEELDRKAMAAVHGGRINDPFPQQQLEDPNDGAGSMSNAWWIGGPGGLNSFGGGVYGTKSMM